MKPTALSSAQRAELFRALARLQDAGVPADRAVAAMRDLLGARHVHRLKRMSALVTAGVTLSEAGSRVGLFSRRDGGLMRLAERAGAFAPAASALADAYAYRARIVSKLRGRMLLPLLVLLLALFLLPLPSLVGGQIGAAEYVLRAFGPLVILTIAAAACAGAARGFAARGVSPVVGRLLLKLPISGPAAVQTSRLQLLEALCLLLAAGVPAREATREALESLSNAGARATYSPSLRRLEKEGLSRALHGVGALEDSEFALASASEEAGRLVDGLDRVAGTIRAQIESRLELLSEWLPRVVYLLVVMVIAAGLIG